MKPEGEELDDIDIEFDGYETAASSEDFEDDDDGYVDKRDVDPKAGNNPLEHINIHPDDYSESYLPDVQMRDTEDPFKNTELVLKFNYKIKSDALKWFIKRVTAKKSQGGAELLLRREPYLGQPDEGLVVHVTAAGWRLLEVAEKLEIKKMDYSRDLLRPFQLNELDNFLTDSMEISDILTSAEKQIVVVHELKHFHAHPGENHVPGYRHIKLTVGQSIFHVFTTTKLISSYFALHQEEELNKLDGKWFFDFWDSQPFEDIRSYFGDSTCLYFNFVAYYSLWLTIPAVIGLIMIFLPDYLFYHLVFYFCIINMLFVTIFLIMWQRYQSRLTYRWGTLRMNQWEDPRENFEGVLALDPVTGKLQRRYPYYKSALKTYGVSLPVVVLCCGIAIWFMYQFLTWEAVAKQYALEMTGESTSSVGKLFWKYAVPYLPATIYAIIVFVLTKVYRWLANELTEWENHRTETQFERHLVNKMVLFEVANSFLVLFYTAFVKNDSILLRYRLLILLGVVQFLMTLHQSIGRLVFRTGQVKMHEFLHQYRLSSVFRRDGEHHHRQHQPQPYPGLEDVPMEVLDQNDKRVQMSKVEESMAPYDYEEDFDEYLNMYLQFGYIFLFSSVFPPAAAFALVSNLILLSTSLFKRREVYQRALARRVSSIGAWHQAFELMALVAVTTNCALLAVNERLRDAFPDFSDMEWILLFVFIEHGIMGLQYLVKKVSPKIPYKVKVALAKIEFRSRMALKREQAERTRRRLTQVFHPINRYLYDGPQDSDTDLRPRKNTNTSEDSAKASNNKQPVSQIVAPAPASKNKTTTINSTKPNTERNSKSSTGKANVTSKTKKNK